MKKHCCRNISECASDVVDGCLDEADWAQLQEHLERCPPCVRYVEQLGLTVAALRDLEAEPPPAEVRDELLSAFRTWRDTGVTPYQS